MAALVKGVSETMLHTCLQRQRRIMPDAPQEELIRHAAKRLVPHTVPGSPAFHRTALNDLLAIVDSRGVPSLFLTLTADEATGMRWAEVDEMEALLQKTVRNDDLSWRDMPVEMARLFHDRVTNFIHTALLDPDNPILGKITDYTVRYESQVRQGCLLAVQAANQIAALRHSATPAPHTAAPPYRKPMPLQHRGSLHAHILLWVDAADAERVASEITATRCKYKNISDDPENPIYVPDLPVAVPGAPACSAAELFDLVEAKQIHKCRDSVHGCKHNRAQCAYGFPFAVNHNGTTFDEASNRCAAVLLASRGRCTSRRPISQSACTRCRHIYARFCSGDQWVVPYHPAVLLSWGRT